MSRRASTLRPTAAEQRGDTGHLDGREDPTDYEGCFLVQFMRRKAPRMEADGLVSARPGVATETEGLLMPTRRGQGSALAERKPSEGFVQNAHSKQTINKCDDLAPNTAYKDVSMFGYGSTAEMTFIPLPTVADSTRAGH